MKRLITSIVLKVLVSFVVLIAVYFIIRPHNRINFERPPLFQIRNIASIGSALSAYQYDHAGDLPGRLSELMPKYIPFTDMRFFFPYTLAGIAVDNRQSLMTASNQIDLGGAYTYLGKSGLRQNLILYQRTNVWASEGIEGRVLAISSNFAVLQLSPSELQVKLDHLDK
jgi:hypothetical protein